MKLPSVDSVDVSSDNDPCTLAEQAAASKPVFSSNREAFDAYQRELETLAAKLDKTVDALVADAETARSVTPEHERVRTLVRYLGFLRTRL